MAAAIAASSALDSVTGAVPERGRFGTGPLIGPLTWSNALPPPSGWRRLPPPNMSMLITVSRAHMQNIALSKKTFVRLDRNLCLSPSMSSPSVPPAALPANTVTISRALLDATYNVLLDIDCEWGMAPWDELMRVAEESKAATLEPTKSEELAAAKRKEPEEEAGKGDAAAEPKKPKSEPEPEPMVSLTAEDARFVSEWLNVMGGPMGDPEARDHRARVCRLRRALKSDQAPCTAGYCCGA